MVTLLAVVGFGVLVAMPLILVQMLYAKDFPGDDSLAGTGAQTGRKTRQA